MQDSQKLKNKIVISTNYMLNKFKWIKLEKKLNHIYYQSV